MGFPGGSAGKESTCSVGDLGSIPGLGLNLLPYCKPLCLLKNLKSSGAHAIHLYHPLCLGLDSSIDLRAASHTLMINSSLRAP